MNMKKSPPHIWRRLTTLILLAMTMLAATGIAHAACSGYAGATTGPITSKIAINEYNYSGGYIELKIIDPTILADTTNLNGWMLSLLKKSGGGGSARTDYSVSSYLNSCGAGSQYIKIPTGTLGNDSVVVLWSDSSMMQEVDYFRIGQSSYPTFQPSTCFASSELPSTSSVTWHQGALAGSSARKDIARGPDGTGIWIETPYNGSDQGTPCDTNDGTLAITKSVTSASTAYVGEQVSFRVSVSLNGRAQTQSNVTVTDLLPSGRLAYVSHTASPGTYTSGTGVWTIGSLSSGGFATLDIIAKATQVGILTNSASVQSTDFPSGTVTPASASVTGLQPLTLTKAVSPSSVPYNTAATFTVSVKNNSSATLPSGFTVNDTVPSELTAGSPTVSSGSYAGGVWTIPSGMPAGATYTLTLPVTSQTTAGSFTNTAIAVTPFGGSNLTASATLAVGSTVSNFNAFETKPTTPDGAIVGRIFTKMVGAGFDLDVVAISAGAQVSSFSGSVQLELLANTGTPGSGYGADNCPTSNSVIQTMPSVAIAGGRSKASFPAVAKAYRDIRVRITYSGVTPNCSNDSFAIRPAAVTLATIPTMAIPPSATATPTIKAGADFTLRATTSPAAGYAGSLALDAAKLTAQTTTQDATKQNGGAVGALAPASLVVNDATLTNNANYSEVGYLYLAPGAFRDDDFTAVDKNQPTGCNAASTCDCISDTTNDNHLSDALVGSTGRYGCAIGNKTNVSFGRFIPDHFDTIVDPLAVVGMPCPTGLTCPSLFNGFVYSAQPFPVWVSAQKLSGGTTANYSGKFAKNINLAAWDGKGSTTAQNPGPGSLAHNTIRAARFSVGTADDKLAGTVGVSNGSATVTGAGTLFLTQLAAGDAINIAGVDYIVSGIASDTSLSLSAPYKAVSAAVIVAYIRPAYGFTAAPTKPIDIYIRADEAAGGDDVTSLRGAASVEGGIKIASGRILVPNAYGSELLRLSMGVTAQYWNGTRWVTSTTDSVTSFNTNKTTATPVPGNMAVTIAKGPLTVANVNAVSPGLTTFSSGVRTVALEAPGSGNNGNVDISFNAPGYLPSTTGRATFGIYKSRFIYLREMY